MKIGEEDATIVFLDGLFSVVVDIPVARRAGTMLGELRSKGMTIGIADAIIAATALRLGAPLRTNNIRALSFCKIECNQGLGGLVYWLLI